jgi:hypothetical protein
LSHGCDVPRLAIVRLLLLFVPINIASYVGVPPEKGGEVSGTINLLRNLGGSVGSVHSLSMELR